MVNNKHFDVHFFYLFLFLFKTYTFETHQTHLFFTNQKVLQSNYGSLVHPTLS